MIRLRLFGEAPFSVHSYALSFRGFSRQNGLVLEQCYSKVFVRENAEAKVLDKSQRFLRIAVEVEHHEGDHDGGRSGNACAVGKNWMRSGNWQF